MLGRPTMAAYDRPALRSSPCVGNAPVWQAGSAQRALKIGCTSAPKLTVGARATQRQSSLHSSFASQPPASHSSPSAESIEASPQRGAAKVTGTALAARSTPRITSHLASIVARSRTLVGPHVFRGQVAITVRPFRVGRRRTFTAGHLPGIEIVGAARTSASGVVATAPATSDGPPGGVTKRPSWQNDGFGTRADATPASVRTSVATARRIVMPTSRS